MASVYVGLIIILMFKIHGNNCQKISELQISTANIESNLYEVFGHPRNHLYPAYIAHKDKVRDFLYGYLTAVRTGDEITLETVDFNSTNLRDYYNDTVVGRNYYLLFKGNKYGTKDDKVIVLASQYDTANNASGVDNNGSGMTAFLEVARLLAIAKCPREYTILLVANDLEETGSEGIKEFIYNYLTTTILKGVDSADSPEFQGAICYDTMMNWNDTINSQVLPVNESIAELVFPDALEFWRSNQKRGNFMLTTSRDLTDEPITRNLHRRWEMLPEPEKYRKLRLAMPICEGVIQIESIEYTLCRPLLRADYKEFYYYNTSRPLKALMVTDSAQYRGVMMECYGQACDDLSQVTTDKLIHLTKVAKMTLDTLLEMSGYSCPAPITGIAAYTKGSVLLLVTVFLGIFI